MARHPAARRIHQTHTEEDAFVARLIQWSTWARANTRILVPAAAILALLLTVGLYYRNFQAAANLKSESRLSAVRQTVASGNRALAIRDLESLIGEFGQARAANEARLLLAQAYLAEGQPQQAVDAVRTLAAELDNPMGPAAALLLGAAYEAAEDAEQAETAYLRIADAAGASFLQHQALDAAARLRMQRGDAAGAAELYQRLVDQMDAASPERQIYELRLAEARSAAASSN